MIPLTVEDCADLKWMRNELQNLLALMATAEQNLPVSTEKAALRSSMEFVMDSNIARIDEQIDSQTLTPYQLFGSLSGLNRGLAEISSRTVGYDPAIDSLVTKIDQFAKKCMLRASAKQRTEQEDSV